MKIEFYKSSEKAPPKDGSSIIGVFMRDWQTYIDFCYYDCEEHTWVLHKFLIENFEFDPILWTHRKKFKKIVYDAMSKETQEQQ